jgi:hypothetical protein
MKPKFIRLFIAVTLVTVGLLTLGGRVSALNPNGTDTRRNTISVCQRSVAEVGERTAADGSKYISLYYSVLGNDNARRFYYSKYDAIETEPGSSMGTTGVGCTDTGLTGLFWSGGQQVDLSSSYYASSFGTGNALKDVYMGIPPAAGYQWSAGDYTGTTIGAADVASPACGFVLCRPALGIEKQARRTFATVNDAGAAKINGSVVWCSGMKYGPLASTNICRLDAATAYDLGGDFAGYLNGDNGNARNGLLAPYQAAVANNTPITGALGITAGNKKFNLQILGMNTRDAVPVTMLNQCMASKPGTGNCYPPNFPNPADPYINAKAGIVLTYLVAPANNPPTGALSCNPPTSTCCSIHVDFADPDGQTEGQLLKDGVAYGPILTTQPVNENVAAAVPYSTATFTLQVRNRLSGGTASSGQWYTIPGQSVQAGPCAAPPGCGSLSTPGTTPEQGVPFELDASFTYAGGVGPPSPSYSIQISGNGMSPQTFTGSQLTVSPTASEIVLKVLNPPGVTLSPAGAYHVNWTMTYGATVISCWDGGGTPSSPGGTPPGPGTLLVYSKPYVEAFGGDVSTGGGIPNVDASYNPVCTPAPTNPSAIIASWNKRAGGNYAGAGVQYSAQATGVITDFAVGQGSNGAVGVAGQPLDLSFANTNTPPAGVTIDTNLGQFGGSFGGTAGGGAAAPACDGTIIKNAISNGNELSPSGVLFNGGNAYPVSASSNNTFYVKGNVFIDNDITAATTSWGSLSGIPQFRIVALGGNIYIGAGVKNLDGLYYAAPTTGGVGGQIVTCATDTGPISDSALFDTCGTPLTINGSLMAKQILLLRTAGSLSQAGTAAAKAAEIIHYSPEMWLPTAGAGTGSDDAYVSLPPVL